MMKKIALILLIILLSINVLYSQNTKVVTGKVYTLNDLPVMGLSIKAQNSRGATSTDSLGNFIITCMTNDKLIIQGKTIKKKTVKINSNIKDSLKIEVSFPRTDKNVELAIGYGYIDNNNRVSAIQGIKNDKLNYSSYSSVYDIIKQNFSGAMIYDNCVILRGPSSITDNSCAMFIVDGLEVDKIDYINPSDVKSVSIIKDGSAAIYGNKAANGVILIELKKGGDI